MNQQESNPEYLALLAEEMTPEELRELLQRLGQQEFGEPQPTIGAVVEATGINAIAVSQTLKSLRSELLEVKIQKALQSTSVRIGHIENRTDQLETRVEQIQTSQPIIVHHATIIQTSNPPSNQVEETADLDSKATDDLRAVFMPIGVFMFLVLLAISVMAAFEK